MQPVGDLSAELPDLFHGGQLVVMGRYTGKGPSAIKLTGKVGMETKEFVYELTFPEKTNDEREFVEHLWARRKVGYLLDQIRANGEKKELKDEVVALAKKLRHHHAVHFLAHRPRRHRAGRRSPRTWRAAAGAARGVHPRPGPAARRRRQAGDAGRRVREG